MKVTRKIKMNVDRFEVGDQITVKVKGYGKFTATAQERYGTEVLFFFDNCVTNKAMNENGSNEGGFFESDLCRWMNTELIKAFPKKLRRRMISSGTERYVMLRIPTRGEVFGQNDSSDCYAPDFAGRKDQLPLMADRKNRVCMAPDDEYCWYWLMNERLESSAYFASVTNGGHCTHAGASNSYGVRPAFVIENL